MEVDGVAGSVIGARGSGQELVGLGPSTQSAKTLYEISDGKSLDFSLFSELPQFLRFQKNFSQELSATDSASPSTRIAQEEGTGNPGKRQKDPEDSRILNPSSSSSQTVEKLRSRRRADCQSHFMHCCYIGRWSQIRWCRQVTNKSFSSSSPG